jgi:hypothetical protein
MAIGVIVMTLTILAIDIVTPASKISGNYFYFGRSLETLLLLYGSTFQPGLIISTVFLLYATGRLRGLSKSYLLEVISIVIAIQTVVSFYFV